ncbi:unnamed protein product [Prorocentrum cordatum]|uniref:Uncharacterized protein n=1 Tax=Prorocentrum cordatum TaxID=2364126 RepID=A0ABN9X4K7_9DINO|nr:unnamed protein product [Polarella glacialis]
MQAATAWGWPPMVQAQQLWQPNSQAPGDGAHHGFVQQLPSQLCVPQAAQPLPHQDQCVAGFQQLPAAGPVLAPARAPLAWAGAPLQAVPPPAQQGLQQAPQQATAEGCLAVDMHEVLRALDSLYNDELRPYGRILRKRLQERAADAGIGPVNVDAKRLQVACQGCSALSVKAEEGGDWSVVVRGRPDRFVNVYSAEDCYPPELWAAADAYFRGLDDKSMVLPGECPPGASDVGAQLLSFELLVRMTFGTLFSGFLKLQNIIIVLKEFRGLVCSTCDSNSVGISDYSDHACSHLPFTP